MTSMDKPSFFVRIREIFTYGLMILIPMLVTVWFVEFLVHLISGPTAALLGKEIPIIISFILSLIIIFLVGLFARNFFGRSFLRFFEGILMQLPIIRMIYKSVKQIIEAFNMQGKSAMTPVLVEYPRLGTYALGYLTTGSVVGLLDKQGRDIGADKVGVFIPTTPNPTSGFFIYVLESEVIYLDMTVEESAKIIMSAGVVQKDVGEIS